MALVPRSVQTSTSPARRIARSPVRPRTVALAVATRRGESDPAAQRAVKVITRLVDQDV